MLTRLFTAALMLGLVLTTPAPAQQPATTNVPHIHSDDPVYDFGTVDQADSVEHTYVVKNTGTVTLEISRVQPSCGCTVAEISNKNVSPGDESRITTRFSPAGRSGPQHKAITIYSNDPDHPQYTLTLQGVVGSAVSVQPSQITMPRLEPGSLPTADLFVSSGDGTAFQVTAVESTSDDLAAHVEQVEEGKNYRVHLALKKPLEGMFTATVLVRTDHPRRPEIQIPVRLMATRDVIVAPREIMFDKPGSEAVSRFVLVRNSDGSPVQIDAIEPPTPDIKVDTQPFGSNGVRIQMSGIVPNNDINGHVLRIQVRGNAIEVPIRVQGI